MSVWIIGGTGDSARLAFAISAATSNLVVTVTTPEARQLYKTVCDVVVGRMDGESMVRFCRDRQIIKIVDASHPFGVEVSQNAIATAKILDIPYLRYERDTVSAENSNLNVELPSFEALLEGNYLLNKRVLLTVGCQVLPLFESWHERSLLFARVLPKLNSLQMALDAGFTSDRIIAIRPPIGEQLEIALWQQWQISLVVTKASGKSGGEDLKQKVANKLGIPLIIIARPKVDYPQQTSSLERVIDFCTSYKN